jgi:hypothetical protein
MKTRNFAVLAIVAIAIMTAASCSIPDYQLGWGLEDASQPGGSGTTILVPYSISNIGYEKLYDATIRISVDTGVTTYSNWTTPVDLGVGDSDFGTVYIYVSGTYVIGSEAVTGAGWNSESKTW